MSSKKNDDIGKYTGTKETHEEMTKRWLENSEVKEAYDDLENEFLFLKELLNARKAAGLTQEEVAKRMGTKKQAITRLEGAGRSNHHSPSIATLRKYANAVNCQLDIKLIPILID